MPARPTLSLCIPTYNRGDCLRGALESGLAEAERHPGVVEMLVCDNASSDPLTAGIIAELKAAHPELRVFRNDENLGFDRNYLRCIQEAKGEYVWVLGDDDEWMPGSVARMLAELEGGADACLCLAQACDLDLNPVVVLPWFLDEEAPAAWSLREPADLARYFDACARTAAVFAFISVAVFRRDRFLENRDLVQRALGSGYVHLWGMMAFLRRPTELRYIPQALIRNRISDLHADSHARKDLYHRWMQDLRSWDQVADELFGEDPQVRDAFCRILGRNHHDTILPGMRRCAPGEAAWKQAVPLLERAGFSAVQIAATDFGYRHLNGTIKPMPSLDPAGLCLADLPLVTRGARRLFVLALGGLSNVLESAALLAALREQAGTERVLILTAPEAQELLDGFLVLPVDPRRYASDAEYREPIVEELVALAPELVMNLDPLRGIEADDLVSALEPAGAIAYELPSRGQDADLVKALNEHYTRLLPAPAGPAAMAQALGLEAAAPTLWIAPEAMEETRSFFANQGWDPARTLALLVDHPGIPEDPAFRSALQKATDAGWNLVGLGGRGTYAALEALLAPLEGRGLNLAGSLGLASIAGILQQCGACAGGTPLLRSLAAACGCARFQE